MLPRCEVQASGRWVASGCLVVRFKRYVRKRGVTFAKGDVLQLTGNFVVIGILAPAGINALTREFEMVFLAQRRHQPIVDITINTRQTLCAAKKNQAIGCLCKILGWWVLYRALYGAI